MTSFLDTISQNWVTLVITVLTVFAVSLFIIGLLWGVVRASLFSTRRGVFEIESRQSRLEAASVQSAELYDSRSIRSAVSQRTLEELVVRQNEMHHRLEAQLSKIQSSIIKSQTITKIESGKLNIGALETYDNMRTDSLSERSISREISHVLGAPLSGVKADLLSLRKMTQDDVSDRLNGIYETIELCEFYLSVYKGSEFAAGGGRILR